MEKEEPMFRYLLNPDTRVLVKIDEKGNATFFNEAGFRTGNPVIINSQDSAVRIFQQHGYKEVPPI